MTLTNENSESEKVDPLTKVSEFYDTIIIGGGVAGLSAGLYSARDGHKTLILEGEAISNVDFPGGALMLTPDIENFPGFPGGEGSDLVFTIRDQAESFGATFVEERALRFDFIQKIEEELLSPLGAVSYHKIHTANKVYESRTVILAMGATARMLQVNGELEYYGRGVSTCATCDGYFFKNKNVAVIGGGDTAIEDALYLTKHSHKVYLVVRKNELKAAGPQAKEILTHPQIEIIWDTIVEEIIGDDNNVKSVVLKNVLSEEESILEVDGVFVAIGRDPATSSLLDTGVLLDNEGYLIVDGDSTHVAGTVDGVYGAGDVVDKIYRQAITSAGKGAQAALEARHYLLSHK